LNEQKKVISTSEREEMLVQLSGKRANKQKQKVIGSADKQILAIATFKHYD
jgi:hypothetical protein